MSTPLKKLRDALENIEKDPQASGAWRPPIGTKVEVLPPHSMAGETGEVKGYDDFLGYPGIYVDVGHATWMAGITDPNQIKIIVTESTLD